MQSQLRPENILRNQAVPPDSFLRFMTGGGQSRTLSSVGSAANNIVRFSNGSIRPNTPDVASSINNISTNVSNFETQNITRNIIQSTNKNFTNVVSGLNNQYQGIIGKIQSQVQNTLSGLIQNFTKDYQKRIQDTESRKSSSILRNFLSLYQNAINIVSFFGDEKNHKRISNSLKTLRRVFSESFEVATVIRQTISKIVKQLSNLPAASGNAPDLNLDVKVPGDKLRQTGGRSIGQFARSRTGMAIGAATLGIGGMALGATAMSGMQRARQFQEEELRTKARGADSTQIIPDSFLDSLENIISRFTNAVEKLVGASQQRPDVSSSSGSTSQQLPPTPSLPPAASAISMDEFSQQDLSLMGRMIEAETEGGTPEDKAGVMNVILNRFRLIKSGIAPPSAYGIHGKTKEETTLTDILSVRDQWQPWRDGKLSGISDAQGQQGLQQALSVGGNDPARMYQFALSRGLSPEDASTYARSSAFYSSGRTPFPTMPEVRIEGLNAHRFQESSNYRLPSNGIAFPASIGTMGAYNPTSNSSGIPSQLDMSRLQQLLTTRSGTPAQSTAQVAPSIQHLQLPPTIMTSPAPTVTQGSVSTAPMPVGGDSSGPDVSDLMNTSNSENPYIFLPFSLGIIA